MAAFHNGAEGAGVHTMPAGNAFVKINFRKAVFPFVYGVYRAGLFARNGHIGNGVIRAGFFALAAVFAFVRVNFGASVFKRYGSKFAGLLARAGQAALARFGHDMARFHAAFAGNIQHGKRGGGNIFTQKGLFGVFV